MQIFISDGIEVHGILFIFDLLLSKGLLTFSEAIQGIELLYQINERLPLRPKEERLKHWHQSRYFRHF